MNRIQKGHCDGGIRTLHLPPSTFHLSSYQPSTILRDILRQAAAELTLHDIDQPQLLSEHFISHVLNCARLELYGRADDILEEHQVHRIHDGIKRLTEEEPLQYVIGQADFMGRRFKVDHRCLIPRPETEVLVEWVSGFEPLWKSPRPVVVDVGTGSGCIVISLALDKPEGQYMAIDISESALNLARENAALHGVQDQIQFMCNHLLTGIPCETVDAVISNPPYVRTADWKRLECQIRDHEPRVALDGGSDGFSIIGPLIPQAFNVLKPGGFIFLETGEDRWPGIQACLKRTGFHGSQVRQDLAGKNRMICANK